DDLNISVALGAVFDFMRDINKLEASKQDAQAARAAMMDFNKVLGVIEVEEEAKGLEDEIERLIQERREARKAKDFQKADDIRDSLLGRGIVLEDTPHGVRWKKAT
ncbi:MAG: cysteine--tRNA ligase, partial [Planctomycetes bacterium]|nr:cysteine--tRNA ligase [Planctomycetota bacterium]